MGDAGNTLRLPVIGIMGSGRSTDGAELAEIAAHLVAKMGCHLLTGGGGGLMGVVSRAFTQTAGRKGISIGVIPAQRFGGSEPPNGYPNKWIELPIQTHLTRSVGPRGLRSRNTVNVLTSSAIIFLPGGRGTFSELRLARRFGRPRILFLGKSGKIEGRTADALSEYAHPADTAGDVKAFIESAV